MSEICIYGGLNQIGGNKILIKDGEEALLFDFGISFEDKGKFFSEFLEPRSVNGIGDYLCFNLIPDIPCLYRDDLATPINYPIGEPPINAVFITHAHTDHFGYIPFIREDIPIFASDITTKMIESYETVSSGGVEKEISSIKKRPFGKYISNSKWEECGREFHSCGNFNGGITVNSFEVDHSVWGAVGFEIDTSDRKIIYTGDLRQHGERKNLTIEALEKLKGKEIDILMIEGTNVGNEADELYTKQTIEKITGKSSGKKLKSENALKEEALKIIQGAQVPVFVDFGLRDFDRFKAFYEIAQNSDRKLVIPAKLAKHLEDLEPYLKIKPSDENLFIYQEPKSLGSYDEREYFKWERAIYNLPNVIKKEDVRKDINNLIIVTDFFHLKNLIDFKPDEGIYIHSVTEPFTEEEAYDFKRHLEWIKFFNLKYYYLHTSGHMGAEEVFQIIDDLEPKQILPIHTKGNEIFKKRYSNLLLPQKNQVF